MEFNLPWLRFEILNGISSKCYVDFDECLHDHFHDCSTNAYCFNIRGTYVCSCKEGFSDLSENSIYPGRICSADEIGCEKCYYHGTCYTVNDHIDSSSYDISFSQADEVRCDCFRWYTGANCQINLKGDLILRSIYIQRTYIIIIILWYLYFLLLVLLFGLVLLCGALFALMLICLILTCWKRNRNGINRRRAMVPGIGILPDKTLSHRPSRSVSLGVGDAPSKLEKRAMIEETNSETSDDTCNLPYVTKKVL